MVTHGKFDFFCAAVCNKMQRHNDFGSLLSSLAHFFLSDTVKSMQLLDYSVADERYNSDDFLLF